MTLEHQKLSNLLKMLVYGGISPKVDPKNLRRIAVMNILSLIGIANLIPLGIPVVALTAYAMLGDEQKAFEAGCAGYISKPLDTKEFPQLIARYLA